MKILISILIVITTAFNANADVGSCAIYKCTIGLSNNTTAEGYFQLITSTEPRLQGNDLLKQLKESINDHNDPSIILYSKIQRIKYPKIKNSETFSYTAAAIKDTRLIKVKNIQSIQIIQMTSCECFSDEKGNPDYSKSIFDIRQYHKIIDDVTQHEIDLLNSSAPIFKRFVPGSDIDASLVLNYNPKIEKIEFEKLTNLLSLKKKEDQSWDEYYKAFEANYNKVRKKLRDQGIIVIELMNYS